MTESIRNIWKRFRAWQLEPFAYEFSSAEKHQCVNCKHEFIGNYCPYCSQKAKLGRVTWQSVHQSIGEIWGMGSRSMTYSLLQLFLRPGYFIRDYISGKRQISFPPVKMLLLVALIISAITQFFDIKYVDASLFGDMKSVVSTFFLWADANKGWGMMAISSLLILPTWILFRHAPGYNRHTLPEGFFIQIFMGILMVFVLFLDLFTKNILTVTLVVIVPPLYYLVTYHQLFGYGWWGTIWRTLLCFAEALLVCIFLAVICQIGMSHYELPSLLGAYALVVFLAVFLTAIPLYIGFVIGRNGERKRDLEKNSDKQFFEQNAQENSNDNAVACIGSDGTGTKDSSC